MSVNYGNTDDLVNDFEDEQENTLTFEFTTEKGSRPWEYYVRDKKIDGREALQQHIAMLLSIEADQYIIYPYTLGIKTVDLIGMPYYYVIAVIPGRIKDALLNDERITDITDFEFEVNRNELHVTFVVHSIYGDITEETVVNF